MADLPETRYAKTDDGVHIAYQVVGEGPIDLVFAPGWVSHVEWSWEYPPFAHLLGRLASFSRLIWFDRRGLGLSDRPNRLTTLEDQMDDIGAVMAAADSERAALFGTGDGCVLCLMYAATHPDKVVALVTMSAIPRFLRSDDYPSGVPAEVLEHWVRRIERAWGRDVPSDLMYIAPSRMEDTAFREWYARLCRLGASPAAITELLRIYALGDTREVLSSVRVPTLVLHRIGDQVANIANARYLADRIPDARLVELSGSDDLVYAGDTDAVVDEVQEFLTGARSTPRADRVLATVLMTDIVGSTEQAATIGDERWRELLDAHDGVVDRQLTRFRGQKVNPTGDGVLATFDGPARAVQCALALVDAMRGLGIEIRVGVHTGEVERRGDDIGGIAVHIGARVASVADASEVLVSRTVTDLVAGSGIKFQDRGEHELKGVPGAWQLFAAQG